MLISHIPVLGIANLQHSKNPVQTLELLTPNSPKKMKNIYTIYTNYVYNL